MVNVDWIVTQMLLVWAPNSVLQVAAAKSSIRHAYDIIHKTFCCGWSAPCRNARISKRWSDMQQPVFFKYLSNEKALDHSIQY